MFSNFLAWLRSLLRPTLVILLVAAASILIYEYAPAVWDSFSVVSQDTEAVEATVTETDETLTSAEAEDTSLLWIVGAIAFGLLSFVLGLVLAIGAFALLSIFFKDSLINRPDLPDRKNRISLFIEVEENRAAVIDRSGSPISIIRGGDKPTGELVESDYKGKAAKDGQPSGTVLSWPVWSAMYPEKGKGTRKNFAQAEDLRVSIGTKWPFSWLFRLWLWFQLYVYNNTGLYVYFPYFTKPKVIPLPRYRVDSESGNKVYRRVKEGDNGYFTNHVRLAPTPWYFKYTGVDIDGVPFTVTGSILYQIDNLNRAIYNSLYKAKDWNVLLDEAANSVIRSAIRDEASIDSVLGKVERELWEDPEKSPEKTKKELFGRLSRLLLDRITGPVIGQIGEETVKEAETLKDHPGLTKLSDYGIQVFQIFITDFDSELTGEELAALRAPVLGRQKARSRELAGIADAAAQQALRDVHGEDGSAKIIEADALVRALQGTGGPGGGGSPESALLATLVQLERGKKE